MLHLLHWAVEGKGSAQARSQTPCSGNLAMKANTGSLRACAEGCSHGCLQGSLWGHRAGQDMAWGAIGVAS